MTDSRLAGVAIEALTSSPSDARVAAVAVEVLTPTTPIKGRWGIPMAANS